MTERVATLARGCALLLGMGAMMAPLWAAPPTRVASMAMPASVQGRFDHLGLDVPGGRLFATAETAKEVMVFNLKAGKYERAITGLGIPHAVLYRPDENRLFVTDGGAGGVRIYNGTTLKQIGFVPLKVDTDSIAYDPATHLLYVVNGGGDAHQTYSMVSVVDTTRDTKAGDIRINGNTLEQLAIDPGSNRLYVANPSKGEVDIVDRTTRTVTARWPVTLGRQGVSLALDTASHRLFVGCRSGVIVVFDTRTGKQLKTLKIGTGIDDLMFNPVTKRIYAPCGNSAELVVYQEQSPDSYTQVATVHTARGAKNITFDSASGRLYTTVPPAGGQPGAIWAYQLKR